MESFARHFMVAIDAWQERGFDAVARSYLERLPGEPGLRYSIDDNGDLLLRRKGDPDHRAQTAAGAARQARLVRCGGEGADGVKLLRTIRLDPSDTFVFEKAAEPGEWAVSGAFEFWDRDPATFEGKARSAFRGGFLGVDRSAARRWCRSWRRARPTAPKWSSSLAQRLVAHFGAPDMAAAGAAAEEEVAFAESLCSQPQDTLVAVHRTFEDGAVRETFRTLRPREGQKPARAFSFLEVEGEDEEQPGETVDLIGMAGRERK